MILFELVNATTASQTAIISDEGVNKHNVYKTVTENLKQADKELQDLYYSVKDFILNLGDDIQEKVLKYYIAFKKYEILLVWRFIRKANRFLYT